MKISIITTHYQRPEHLRLFLAALALQTRQPDEVIIADDGSDAACVERVQALIATQPFPVQFLWAEHQDYRVSATRNRGIRAAEGDYLVFIDCDIALMPIALEQHLAVAKPGRVLAGHRGILSEAATQHLFAATPMPTDSDWAHAWQEADLSEAEHAAELHRHHTQLRRYHLARPHKPKILGCHFSLHRTDVMRVNGFDEMFVGWGYEDDDFARRLYAVGVQPWSVIREAQALHLWHPSLAPQSTGRHRDRPNRAYFRRWHVPAFCEHGILQ